jgi:uncharacterized protein YfbU (UPF0304 family)
LPTRGINEDQRKRKADTVHALRYLGRLEVGDSVDTKLIREAIHTGNTWAIADTHTGILASPDKTEFVEEVGHVLQMWERLELDFEELTTQEKERVLQKVRTPVRFSGFDGNNEHEHVSVANFYIKQMERFVHFKDRDMDAHMMTLGRHRQMLGIWESILLEGLGRRMTADEITRVMNGKND